MDAQTHTRMKSMNTIIDWNDLSRGKLPTSFLKKNAHQINWELKCEYHIMTQDEI